MVRDSRPLTEFLVRYDEPHRSLDRTVSKIVETGLSIKSARILIQESVLIVTARTFEEALAMVRDAKLAPRELIGIPIKSISTVEWEFPAA
jgi:hypothetical protein